MRWQGRRRRSLGAVDRARADVYVRVRRRDGEGEQVGGEEG